MDTSNPFNPKSLKGQWLETHNKIINMQDSLIAAQAKNAATSKTGLVDTDDIEDVMLPYSDIHYENPLYVQLEEGSWVRESPRVQNQGPKVHAIF